MAQDSGRRAQDETGALLTNPGTVKMVGSLNRKLIKVSQIVILFNMK
jgi:hypothetical protein